MRISDWSSDVCSSDLRPCADDGRTRRARCHRRLARGASGPVSEAGAPWPIRILHLHSSFSLGGKEARAVRLMNLMEDRAHHTTLSAQHDATRSEERREGRAWVSRSRYRG